jgi:hypothetical protein
LLGDDFELIGEQPTALRHVDVREFQAQLLCSRRVGLRTGSNVIAATARH